MQNAHIVTDSTAHFATSHYVDPAKITIVPYRVTIGGKTYREGVDVTAEDALRLMTQGSAPPVVEAPTEQEYLQVYANLARTHDTIVSVHASREIYPGWQRARNAAQQMVGHCNIEVLDSQTLSVSQAMLVRVAARAVETEATLDDVVRVIRGAIDRAYAVFYVETMDYLVHSRILAPSHTILGSMLGIKPFLSIEEGELIAMEKVRTRVQAVERLVEFAVEFTDVDDAVIVQHKSYMAEQTRMLQDRLAVEFPDRHFPHALYGPSLAALIGTDATGLVVLESELSEDEDDF